MERVAEGGVQFAQPRCPFCHDEIPSGSPQLACNTCRAWHHQECWAESGQRCAACGSGATGFLSADVAPAGEPKTERDPTTEFRFRCPHCKEAMWAPHTTVGRMGVCPSCKRETTVPKIGAKKGLKGSGTWQSELTSLLVGSTAIALALAATLWFVGLIGELFSNHNDLAGPWFRYGFSAVYLLFLFAGLFSVDDRTRTPRKRIVFCGLLGMAGFFGAWWAGANAWVLSALLPPWPLIVLGYLHESPEPETPPPVPGKAPWQGE